MRKATIIGVIAFIVLLVLFFNKIVLIPENAVTINADLLRMTSVWEGQINEGLKQNSELPLWNADVFSGTPLIGSPLTAMFYPLSIIFYFIPFHEAFVYVLIANLALMAIFFYMYLRLIKISRFSAFFSVVIFSFSGIVMLWSGILSFINALMWFPLLLYLVERLVVEKRIIFGLLAGIFFGIQILGSGPQIFLYSAFILLLYLALRLSYERKESFKVISIFALAIIISILISAVQLMPMLEYSKYSIRDKSLDYDTSTMHSLPGYALITFLMPEFYGRGSLYWGFWRYSSFTEQYIYIGIVTLFLLLTAILFIRKNKYVTIFALMALFALLFSFGKYTPFYKIFYYLPLFGSFRAPVRMMIFFVFSAAVISGFSLDALHELDEIKKKKLKKALMVISILVIVVAAATLIVYQNKYKAVDFGENIVKKLYESNQDASRITRNSLSLNYFISLVPYVFLNIMKSIGTFLIIISVILFLFYFWLNNSVRFKHFKILLLLVLVAELFVFSSKFIDPGDFQDKVKTTPIMDEIKKDSDMFRVLSLRSYKSKDNVPQYLAVYNDVQLASGCDAIFLKKYAEYSCYYGNCEVKADACIPISEVKYPKMIDLLNVKYVVSPNEVNDNSLAFVKNDDGVNLYKNKDHISRAFFVTKANFVGSEEEVLKILSDEKFNPFVTAVIESQEKKENINRAGDSRGLKIKEHSQNRVVIEDDFQNGGFAVLSEVNYAGWKAYIDGNETKLYDVDYILKGVHVDGGWHKIEFVYEPMSYKVGGWLSLISAIALLIAIIKYRNELYA